MNKTLINYFYNAAYAYLFWVFIGFVAKYSEVVAAFQNESFIVQAGLFTWFTLAFFIVIIKLKDKILEDRVISKKEKVAWYSFVIPFALVDVALNIVFIAPVFMQAANTMNEGWLLTSHAKAIRKYSLAKIAKGQKLTTLEAWRFWHCENWIGPVMNIIDKGHYSDNAA